jgi:hypothetical protein
VLDCDDGVLQVCPADQGCSPDGTCVAPCDSAAANKSTIGCDYYSVIPGAWSYVTWGQCFAAYVANTWSSPVTVTAEYAGKALNVASLARIPMGSGSSLTYAPLPNGQIPPGQVAIMFLADDVNLGNEYTAHCPCNNGAPCASVIIPGVTDANAWLASTGIAHAFHVHTSAPVVAYDIYPYGGASAYITSATLLVPTSAWDINYVAVDAYAAMGGSMPDDEGTPFIQVVASADDTHVKITPTADIMGGNGVSGTPKGQAAIYKLNQGDVLQVKQASELNGSAILSDKPIGVWGGSGCMDITTKAVACDSGHQQLFPVQALGSEYVAVRHRSRETNGAEEVPPWRIMGVVDGTTLSYDPFTPAGAPTTLDSGKLVEFDEWRPFVVRSQDDKHPFYVSAHMLGEGPEGISGLNNGYDYGSGDPEFVNVITPQQFLSSYLFFTDPTMYYTNLVLVRPRTKDGTFKDVSLDCAGVVGGWTDVDAAGRYQMTRVDLRGWAPLGTCDNGAHEMHSDAPFGLTVWGWDSYVSYAYPGGAAVKPINSVVVVPK